MKYSLKKYELQKVENTTILFLVNDNAIDFNQCIVLEGTGLTFFECIAKYDNKKAVIEALEKIYPKENQETIYQDLNDFMNKLVEYNLLIWSGNHV